MGDIANDLIDGTMCQECGTYIGEGPGYPRYCSDCKPKKKKKKKLTGPIVTVNANIIAYNSLPKRK